MGDRAFVISIDSLEDSDILVLLEKKNFQRLLDGYSSYSNLESAPTQPTLTLATLLSLLVAGLKIMGFIITSPLIRKEARLDGSGGPMI